MVGTTELFIAFGVCVAVTASIYFLNKNQKQAEDNEKREEERKKREKSPKNSNTAEQQKSEKLAVDENENIIENLKLEKPIVETLKAADESLLKKFDKPSEEKAHVEEKLEEVKPNEIIKEDNQIPPTVVEPVKEKVKEKVEEIKPNEIIKEDNQIPPTVVEPVKEQLKEEEEEMTTVSLNDKNEIEHPIIETLTNTSENEINNASDNQSSAPIVENKPAEEIIVPSANDEPKNLADIILTTTPVSPQQEQEDLNSSISNEIKNLIGIPLTPLEAANKIENLINENLTESVISKLVPTQDEQQACQVAEPEQQEPEKELIQQETVNKDGPTEASVEQPGTIETQPTQPFIDYTKEFLNSGFGKVEFTIYYDTNRSKLCLIIHSAEDLVNVDKKSLSDPFVRIILLPDPKKITKHKTRVIKDSLNPVWEETFEWTMTRNEALSKTLELLIRDEKSVFTKQDSIFLGQLAIPLSRVDLFTTPTRSTYWLQPENALVNMLKDL